MFAIDVQTAGSVGIALLLTYLVEWLVKYLSLNMSLWLSDQVGTDNRNSPMWAPPIPAVAFYLLLVTKGTEVVSRRLFEGPAERTLDSLILVLSARMIVAALIGGWIVRSSLGVPYPRGVAIAAVTVIASEIITGILLSLLLSVIRTAA